MSQIRRLWGRWYGQAYRKRSQGGTYRERIPNRKRQNRYQSFGRRFVDDTGRGYREKKPGGTLRDRSYSQDRGRIHKRKRKNRSQSFGRGFFKTTGRRNKEKNQGRILRDRSCSQDRGSKIDYNKIGKIVKEKLATEVKKLKIKIKKELREDFGKIANVALKGDGREKQDTGFIENNSKVWDVIRKTTKQTKEQLAEHEKKKSEIE